MACERKTPYNRAHIKVFFLIRGKAMGNKEGERLASEDSSCRKDRQRETWGNGQRSRETVREREKDGRLAGPF